MQIQPSPYKQKMEKRPKIRLELTNSDKALELTGWFALLVIWVLIIVSYKNLPDIIPTHYNGAGKADGFGEKTNILILPIIATILFVGLTLLNRVPHIFNYPTHITKENAMRQYTLATRLLRNLKLYFVAIFGYIVFRTIQNAKGQAEGLGAWFLPVSLVIVSILLIYPIVKLLREK
jgi:uncharacterized membrane protein